MKFYKQDDLFVIEEEGMGLAMTREEAEELFVMIGHVLQDDDVTRYVEESTESEQPNV